MDTLLYKNIANKMEDLIKNGIWKENDKLPSERELSQQYNVSRTVIREALKTLNEKQLIINRPGKGNYVSIPTTDFLTSQFESFADYNKISMQDLVDAREELEIIIGKRAVKNISRKQLQEITAIYDEMNNSLNDNDRFNSLDYSFHLKLAECSGNKALQMIFSSLYSITGNRNHSFIRYNYQTCKNSQFEHMAILNTLKSRSPRNMANAIHSHMQCIKEHII